MPRDQSGKRRITYVPYGPTTRTTIPHGLKREKIAKKNQRYVRLTAWDKTCERLYERSMGQTTKLIDDMNACVLLCGEIGDRLGAEHMGSKAIAHLADRRPVQDVVPLAHIYATTSMRTKLFRDRELRENFQTVGRDLVQTVQLLDSTSKLLKSKLNALTGDDVLKTLPETICDQTSIPSMPKHSEEFIKLSNGLLECIRKLHDKFKDIKSTVERMEKCPVSAFGRSSD